MNLSYFGNLKHVKYPLSICQYPPEWYSGPQFKQLAPKADFLKAYKDGTLDEKGFTEAYIERVLNKFDPIEIYERLTGHYTENVTLLCYERAGVFCHRNLVGVWLAAANNVTIRELS